MIKAIAKKMKRYFLECDYVTLPTNKPFIY